jgi:hypothetical protein
MVIVCENCKFWTETNKTLRYGRCAYYDKLTEWCAGTIAKFGKHPNVYIKSCPAFRPRMEAGSIPATSI